MTFGECSSSGTVWNTPLRACSIAIDYQVGYTYRKPAKAPRALEQIVMKSAKLPSWILLAKEGITKKSSKSPAGGLGPP